MKAVDVLIKVIILVLLVIGIIKLTHIETKSENFFEYNGSKINLQKVYKITPRVEYIITFKEDSKKDIFRKYSTALNEKEIQNIGSFLALAKESKYYSVAVSAFMMFDNRKVELFRSSDYLKLAHEYEVNEYLLEVLNSYGLDSFQFTNLEKLKGKVYTDRENFLEEVVAYGKLKREGWIETNIPRLGLGANAILFMEDVSSEREEKPLTQDEIDSILTHLGEAYSVYKGLE